MLDYSFLYISILIITYHCILIVIILEISNPFKQKICAYKLTLV